MLRASWIPSPLMPPGSRPAVPIVDTAKPSRFRSALVIAQFAALGLSLLVLLVTRGDQDRFAHRVRELFERLGGLWIKVGQVIALRIDFLPAALCRELSRLQSQAVGFPEHVARGIVEEELGGPLERWFDGSRWAENRAAAVGSAMAGAANRAKTAIRRNMLSVLPSVLPILAKPSPPKTALSTARRCPSAAIR